MTDVVPVFYPVTDVEFRDTARRVLDGQAWDFQSDEELALMGAVLQTHYPMAAVVITRRSDSRLHSTTFVDLYRDPETFAAAVNEWLSAVYDGAGPPAYRLALRLLGDKQGAEAVVEQAFNELVLDPRADIDDTAQSVHATAYRLARSNSSE